MSVSQNVNGTLIPIAGNAIQNTFTGTTAQVEAAIQSGVITEGMVVYITDDGVNENAENIGYDNTDSGLTATDVQAAIDEIKSDLPTLVSGNLTNTPAGSVTVSGAKYNQYGKVVNITISFTPSGEIGINGDILTIGDKLPAPYTVITFDIINANTGEAVGRGYLSSNGVIHASSVLPVTNYTLGTTYICQ